MYEIKRDRATVAVFFYTFPHHVTKTQMWDIQTDQSENYTSPIVLKVWQFIDPEVQKSWPTGLDHYQPRCVFGKSKWSLWLREHSKAYVILQ